jgi:hypothetical protein
MTLCDCLPQTGQPMAKTAIRLRQSFLLRQAWCSRQYLPGANGADAQWASVEAARQWVLRQLEAQGVQLTGAA